jgi:SprT protein
MSKDLFSKKMMPYMPEEAISLVYSWLEPHNIRLKITKPRRSKLGDFRVKGRKEPAIISVNGNLNPFSFLITLTHEVAHLKDFDERKTLREAHGANWKRIYSNLLSEVINTGAFPYELHPALHRHINNPKAASCSDAVLLDALRQYDDEPKARLKELEEGAQFLLSNGMRFERGELKRTRYKCQELNSKKWYLVHGEAEVIKVDMD